MRDDVEQLLKELTARNSDRRLHVFQLHVDSLEGDALRLSGRVLEQENLDDLREAIRARFPALRVDDSSIRVLRCSPAKYLSVATNLTDLHVGDGFLTELLTQVTNGVRLEELEARDRWRFVRQADGYLGWAFNSYLTPDAATGPATHMIESAIAPVFQHVPADAGPYPVTRLLAGTRVRVAERSADGSWSRIEHVGRSIPGGWTKSELLRDLAELPLAPALARQRMIEHARRLTGTYYLWGGCTAFGIDCSGLAQLVHRLCGYELPRDADMQFAAGRAVPGGDDGAAARPGDLLFFSESGTRITHVGLSLGGWNIIHSSRFHNGVYEDDVRERDHLKKSFAGVRTFLPPE